MGEVAGGVAGEDEIGRVEPSGGVAGMGGGGTRRDIAGGGGAEVGSTVVVWHATIGQMHTEHGSGGNGISSTGIARGRGADSSCRACAPV